MTGPPGSPDQSKGDGMRLLIVDDNEDDREMLRRAVARMPDPPACIDEVPGLDKALD